MKYLGIDHGEKRIGIAISDIDGTIALPQRTMLNHGSRTIAPLKALIKKEKISKVVIGLPLGQGGKETDQTQKVKTFVKKLESEISIPVVLENELLTTHLVRQAGVTKEHADEAAAALILQSYLDKENRK